MAHVSTTEGLESPFVAKIRRQWGHLDCTCVFALAEVWEEELRRVIVRMMQVSEQDVGSALHIDARPQAILEMAKLRLWLADKIFEWKLAHATTQALDPLIEREALSTDSVNNRIEETAVICAKHIWSNVVARLRIRWPLVISPFDEVCSGNTVRDLSKRAPRVRRNHFSPVFSNKMWTDEDGVSLHVYTRGISGDISRKKMSYRQWGFEDFLYSNRLESYLALVDDDGARSQRKLLDILPLTSLDKRRWIAFLVIQLLRTPSSLSTMSARLKKILPTIAPTYPTDVASLKRAYETLFTNNQVYANFHRRMAPKRWLILRAPAGSSFIRPDNPVVVNGSIDGKDWCLRYPMTPTAVFQVGPRMGGGYEQDFVPSTEISQDEVLAINERLAGAACRSVLAVPQEDDLHLRRMLVEHLGARRCGLNLGSGTTGLWGALA